MRGLIKWVGIPMCVWIVIHSYCYKENVDTGRIKRRLRIFGQPRRIQ